MLKIKKATIDDAKIIALLGRITFSETFGNLFRDENDLGDYLNRTFSVDKISYSIKKPENIYWTAFWEKLPVGYAKLKLNSASAFIDSGNVCQLQKIYVLNDFLSNKIGQKLQEALLNEATNQKFDSIWLSVWEGNDRAIRFYEKHDFKKIGNHYFEIGKESFQFQAMAKELNIINKNSILNF